MFIQKDIYPDLLKQYKNFQKQATKIDYDRNYEIKPMKETVNLIENMRTSSIKNAPIKNSDKIKSEVIKSCSAFKGSKTLPTFKQDLKYWKIAC
jgi:hypothetical protein